MQRSKAPVREEEIGKGRSSERPFTLDRWDTVGVRVCIQLRSSFTTGDGTPLAVFNEGVALQG